MMLLLLLLLLLLSLLFSSETQPPNLDFEPWALESRAYPGLRAPSKQSFAATSWL